MMIVMSKKHTEISNEMERRLTCEIWNYVEENGIQHRFIQDSKAIQEAIATIASRVATLSETVIIDKDLIRMQKETDKFKNAMQNMGEVDRKLRNPKKKTITKTNGEVNVCKDNKKRK